MSQARLRTDESGVAVVVVDENSAEVAAANNNSMCRVLYPSPDYGRACAEDCGRAYARATEAGGPVEYVCHAGLFCRAVPVPDRDKKLVAILGRTFVSSENYRHATEKAISGDWRGYPPTEFFENVILSGPSAQVERLEAREQPVHGAAGHAEGLCHLLGGPGRPLLGEQQQDVDGLGGGGVGGIGRIGHARAASCGPDRELRAQDSVP